jgi:hypothetical protein
VQAYKLRLSVAPYFKIQREVRISVDRCSKNIFEIYINFFSRSISACEKVECEGLDTHAHFRNFGYSVLTLFRVSTGDNWNGILKVDKNQHFLYWIGLSVLNCSP